MTPEEKIKAFYDGKEFWMDGMYLHYEFADSVHVKYGDLLHDDQKYCIVHIKGCTVVAIRPFCGHLVSGTFKITDLEFHSEYMDQLEKEGKA